jgi:hypothetical protein
MFLLMRDSEWQSETADESAAGVRPAVTCSNLGHTTADWAVQKTAKADWKRAKKNSRQYPDSRSNWRKCLQMHVLV